MEYHTGLEVAPLEHHRFNEHGQTYPQVTPNRFEGPEVLPYEHGTQGIQVLGKRDNTELLQSKINSASGEEKGKRKCGLPVRTFYTVSIVAILLILSAIAGGVAGGIKSSQNKLNPHTNKPKNETMNGNQPITPNVNILAGSKLAASNWMDQNDFTHRFVFFLEMLPSKPISSFASPREMVFSREKCSNYLKDLFDAEDIKLFISEFLQTLSSVIEASEATIASIPVLVSMFRDHDKLWLWNSQVLQLREECVHQLIEQQVRLRPDAIGIDAWDGQMCYSELHQLSNHLARQLACLGVNSGILVLLYLRSRPGPLRASWRS